MKFILAILLFLEALTGSSTAAAQSKFHVVDKVAFYQVTEVQKTPLWCWAATIAMSLRAQGVFWRQEDVVSATKGKIKNETATPQEMTAFLNSWNHFDYDGLPWSVSSSHYAGAAPISEILQSIDSGRPLIITYKSSPTTEHALLLYGANMIKDGAQLHSVYYFDPYTGEKGAVSGPDFFKYTTNTWDVRAFK